MSFVDKFSPTEAIREIAEILAEGYLQLGSTKRRECKDHDVMAHTSENTPLNALDNPRDQRDESESEHE